MKRLIIILTLFMLFLNFVSAQSIKKVSKEYKITAKDGFGITAVLEYPKVNGRKNFSTVVLLHSLGYDSEWWGELPNDLLKNGYAVLKIDLRGHGKSIYNNNLNKVSWTNMTNKGYSKYPDDVVSMIDYVKTENKRIFFNNWAVVGSDIGAGTAILAVNKISYKPKTIVMISPIVSAKGLYVPVKLAELNNIDILSITGSVDINGKNADEYLKKFAQSTYAEYTSDSKSTGMLLLKNDEILTSVITSWIVQYLK